MMQTAVRQAMPYALDKKQLNQNFSIRREASVNSRTSSGPKKVLGITANPSTQTTILARSHSNLGCVTSTSMPNTEERPKSDSTMRVLDKTYMKDFDITQTRRDRIYLEADRDRQSMKDLVEFLRSSKPPPQNYMSVPEDYGRRPTEKASKKPFRLFRKNGSRKNSPRDVKTHLMQLPDSAVAATTIEGHRHIAISIPVQYHPHEPSPARARYDKKMPDLPMTPPLPTRNSRGTVTVLRPVIEDKESPSAQKNAGVYKNDTQVVTTEKPRKTEPVHSDSGKDSKDAITIFYYRQDKIDVPPDANGQGRLVKNYTMPPVSNINRMDSIRSDIDPRHSGGTMYSERTLPTTDTTHSRDVSSGSVSPTYNQLFTLGTATNMPARNSSLMQTSAPTTAIGTATTSLETADRRTFSIPATEVHTPNTEALPRLSSENTMRTRSIAESTFSETSEPVVVSAEVAQAYPGAATIGADSFKTPSPAGPAPNRKLPDLPEGSDDTRSIRTMKSSRRSTHERKSSLSPEEAEKTNLRAVQKTRKEHVEARIRRDVALERARRSTQAVLEAIKPLQTTPQRLKRAPAIQVARTASLGGSYKGHHRRRSSSISNKRGEITCRRNTNSLSPILLVAEFEPQSGRIISDEYMFPRPPRRRSSPTRYHSRRSSIHEIHTPPRSASPSLPSSDEDCTYIPTHKRFASAAVVQRVYSPRHKRGLSSTATNGIRLHELYSAPETDENKDKDSLVPTHRRGASSTATNGFRSRELSAAALLDERRELRRMKRDSLVYEADLDDRMKKMERNVAQLVDMNRSVLEIGKQLGSLSQVLNKEGPGRGKGVLTKVHPAPPAAGRGHGRDLWGVEPLMREILGEVKRN